MGGPHAGSSGDSGAIAPARHVLAIGSGKGGVGKSTVSQGGDQGRPVLIDQARSPQADGFRGIAQRVDELLDVPGGRP